MPRSAAAHKLRRNGALIARSVSRRQVTNATIPQTSEQGYALLFAENASRVFEDRDTAPTCAGTGFAALLQAFPLVTHFPQPDMC